jgi:predicted alpha/beta hydrolase
VDVRTSDGWSLRTEVREPEGETDGTAVLAHAMMARRSEFDRPTGAGVAGLLLSRGWRVVLFDFRGHGESGPSVAEGADFGYDDLVRQDLPAIYAFARDGHRRGRPIVLIGHSLGGHVGLGAQALGLVAFDAIVAVAANLWLRDLEPSATRWLVKRATAAAVAVTCRRVGRFPARALRAGSDDEPLAYFEDFDRVTRTGRWTSRDGAHDYLAALAHLRVPVMQIVSDGDRLACVPVCGARFLERCGGVKELLHVARSDDGGPAPGHMGLVTSSGVASVWTRAEAWLRSAAVAS